MDSKRAHKLKKAWVKTAVAISYLNVSAQTLKRYRSINEGGFLLEGKHYRSGLHSNSSILWDLEAVEEEFIHRGLVRVQADKVLAEV
tara:strand:- start:180 stop:440 length:261 start_codon:yes stop_codon:yes gene_type:complete